PPARGNKVASSDSDNARHRVIAPPRIQIRPTPATDPVIWAMLLGVRKMPLPIMTPMVMAVMLHIPSRRGRTSVRSGCAATGSLVGRLGMACLSGVFGFKYDK